MVIPPVSYGLFESYYNLKAAILQVYAIHGLSFRCLFATHDRYCNTAYIIPCFSSSRNKHLLTIVVSGRYFALHTKNRHSKAECEATFRRDLY